ncbi:hypothetical protein FQN54_008734 [Arachnomyces sp. PD_36]|nr:hypothetical protein FQN54_008734 [Arachnomyces sp. PD_36]
MFYSHEILTSREHGVATVWLVATLGSKSNAKKLNRKAILDVDVPKACGTIVRPEAPMALRLQGNLLIGVSRVYNQQCGYALMDAQAIRDRMRTMLKVIRGNGLDPEAGKARPEQLILPYDSAFDPDTSLPFLDIDFAKLGISMAEAQMKNTRQSSFISTPKNSTPSNRPELVQLNLSSPTMPPMNDMGAFGVSSDVNSSAQKGSQLGRGSMFEEEGFLLDADFEFDEEGNIIELDRNATPQVVRAGSEIGGLSESVVTGRVRRDLEDGLLAGRELIGDEMQLDHNDVALVMGDDENFHLAGEPLLRNQAMDHDPDYTGEIRASSQAAEAPLRRKKSAKMMEIDEPQELRNAQLAQWNAEYIQNMAVASKQKLQNKLITTAKKNAEFWVLGKGIGSVGVGLGSYEVPHPLNAFSGEHLLEMLSGTKSSGTGKKRGRKAGDDTEPDVEDGRRVRPRADDAGQTDHEDLEMNDMGGMVYDDEVEIGREAPPSLHDDHSSQMPWNITASIQGSRFGSSVPGSIDHRGSLHSGRPSSIIHGHDADGNPTTHRIRRMPSASPLAGRSSGHHHSLSGPGHDEDPLSDTNLDNYLGSDDSPYDSFQVHGPAAGVDTQTAAQSQWLSNTLDRESLNFLEFLCARSSEQQKGNDSNGKSVAFSSLLPPETNSRVVATQAFLHVLTLATKGAVRVSQEENEDIFIEAVEK